MTCSRCREEVPADAVFCGVFRAVTTRTWSVWSLAELGEFAEGLARGREAVALAERVEHPGALVNAHLGLGSLHLRRGEIDPALRSLERALALTKSDLGRGVQLLQEMEMRFWLWEAELTKPGHRPAPPSGRRAWPIQRRTSRRWTGS